MTLSQKWSTLFIFRISVFMIIFINFYSKFVLRKVSIKSFLFNTVLNMNSLTFKCKLQCTCNILFVTSNFVRVYANFSLNFRNSSDAVLQLLIFLSTKSFCTNILDQNFALGISYCLSSWVFLDHACQKSVPDFRNLIMFLNLFY